MFVPKSEQRTWPVASNTRNLEDEGELQALALVVKRYRVGRPQRL